VFGQVVRVGNLLEVPDVDRLLGGLDQLARQVRVEGAWWLRRRTGRLRGEHLRTALGTASDSPSALQLAIDRLLPAGRQGRVGQGQQRASGQHLEEVPAACTVDRRARIRLSPSHAQLSPNADFAASGRLVRRF
jgi:hypothetical protein